MTKIEAYKHTIACIDFIESLGLVSTAREHINNLGARYDSDLPNEHWVAVIFLVSSWSDPNTRIIFSLADVLYKNHNIKFNSLWAPDGLEWHLDYSFEV